ncbi:hypothetical protein Mp_4g10890 [Marchantia polymorpha subsp. ruderalis]|uniref:Retropepsins domain-containing protein n=2 Tax=Marchantia polymorpha TaxID=3197 RepID=A0AAF6B8M1_MARPO|nr:hypothetical protein MARPO_0011s0075 [Marchantia polymorpha]BBN08355.1 hypothetical protein Mp_4g10890 [Marchantia polymorpha subsp. ruderalis]|eukprot:PTQ46391.1 hypothetical protein MARPO_0011s0075 [Marchantia polymorpha]
MLDMWRGSSAERLSPGGWRSEFTGQTPVSTGGGRGGRGAVAVGRLVASAASATESAMAARIEQLEQRLAAMAGTGASSSTFHEGEDFPYLASAAQVEASVAVTRGAARALEPRGATGELDPQRAATLCERGSITATSAEIGETIGEELSSTTSSSDESTWQAAAARMESLPARPAIDRESIVPGVCMMDNRSGVFRLVSATGQVYVPARVLLDFGAQPLMLGKIACISLGVRRSELEPCPFQIQTSLGGISDRSYKMTRERILVQLRHGHAQDSSQFGVRAVVTSAESYDVLVGGAVLYPMEFRMDYWTETEAYRPGWESDDGRMSELAVRFISRDRPLGSSPVVLASIAVFSGVLTWPDDLLEGNRSPKDTPVYEEV